MRPLMKLRRQKNLTTKHIALAAGLPLRTVYLAEIGGWISKSEAEQITNGLLRLTGIWYTFDELMFNLKDTPNLWLAQQPTIILNPIKHRVQPS